MSRKSASVQEAFIMHPASMRLSPAWAALSWDARRVLDRLEQEHMAHGGHGLSLICTHSDFEAFGIRRRSIAPAIRECIALGFVELVERGRASISDVRRPSKYRLPYLLSRDKGKPVHPTHPWRSIETAEQAAELVKEAREAKSAQHVRRSLQAAERDKAEPAEKPIRRRVAA